MNAVARRQLGEFLKSRRVRLVREELGLCPLGDKDTGLRREEVAVLSGVSITRYSWLEQGRDVQPSRQVLGALGRALRLSGAELSYVMSLAGYLVTCCGGDRVVSTLPGHVSQLLEELAGLPAYVISADWHILGWSRTFAALYPNVPIADEADRNLLWLVFMDPSVREM